MFKNVQNGILNHSDVLWTCVLPHSKIHTDELASQRSFSTASACEISNGIQTQKRVSEVFIKAYLT